MTLRQRIIELLHGEDFYRGDETGDAADKILALFGWHDKNDHPATGTLVFATSKWFDGVFKAEWDGDRWRLPNSWATADVESWAYAPKEDE